MSCNVQLGKRKTFPQRLSFLASLVRRGSFFPLDDPGPFSNWCAQPYGIPTRQKGRTSHGAAFLRCQKAASSPGDGREWEAKRADEFMNCVPECSRRSRLHDPAEWNSAPRPRAWFLHKSGWPGFEHHLANDLLGRHEIVSVRQTGNGRLLIVAENVIGT